MFRGFYLASRAQSEGQGTGDDDFVQNAPDWCFGDSKKYPGLPINKIGETYLSPPRLARQLAMEPR